MKQNIKKLTSFFLALVCLFSMTALTACSREEGEGKDTQTQEQDQAPATLESIYEAVSAVVPNADKLVDAQETYLPNFFAGAKAEDFASHKIVMQSMSTSVDQIGIFEAKTAEDVKKIEEMIDTYFDFYENDVWNDAYLETEFPKIQNAERVTAGNFVMYVFLDDDTRAAAITAFENAAK